MEAFLLTIFWTVIGVFIIYYFSDSEYDHKTFDTFSENRENNNIDNKDYGLFDDQNDIEPDVEIFGNIHMSQKQKQQHLGSDYWHQLKQKRTKIASGICERCGSAENLELHHIHYLSLGSEDIDDVRLVCRDCHQAIHDKYGYGRNGTYPID